MNTNKVGEIFPTNCGNVRIKEYINSHNVSVVFEDGYITKVQYSALKSGNVKNPNFPSICNKGFIGIGKYNSKDKNIYLCWKGMLNRCYNENSRHIYKSYKDVTVCEEWHNFQNFAKWYEDNYIENWALDKDILCNDCREYAPQNCAFVPREINNFFVKLSGYNNKGNSTGVVKVGSNYQVNFFIGGTINRKGGFYSDKEAYLYYCTEKENYLNALINKYKSLLDYRVYNKLINYKISPLQIK